MGKKWSLGILAVAGVIGWFVFQTYRDTNSLEIRKYVVTAPALSRTLAGLKIALLSDLHVRSADFLEREALRSIEREKPDIILLAGDYIAYQSSYEPALTVLRGLRAPLGSYAVLGNMDYTNEKGSCILCHDRDGKGLQANPTPVFLRNAARKLRWKGKDFYIAGMDDPVIKRRGGIVNNDLAATLAGLDRSLPTILLVHSPELFDETAAAGVELVLSGHNHGGQIAISRFISRFHPVEPSMGYPDGFFRKGNSILYVSRGIGTSRLPFRLGVKPEITFIEFADEQGTPPSREIVRDVSVRGDTVYAGPDIGLFMRTYDFPFHLKKGARTEKTGSGAVLFDFEKPSELDGVMSECHVWAERVKHHATSGEYSLKIEFYPGGTRKIEFKNVCPDWSGAENLEMDVFNPKDRELVFWLRIDDPGDRSRPAMHNDRPLTVRPGMNHLTIRLDTVTGNESKKPMDLKRIRGIMIYSPVDGDRKEFYLDNIRLKPAETNSSRNETQEKRH